MLFCSNVKRKILIRTLTSNNPVNHRFLQKGKEDNVQLCVYVDGKCVVDLYGTAIGDTDYNADTIQVSSLIEIF